MAAQGSVTFRNSVAFTTTDPTGGDRLVYDVGSPLAPITGVALTGTQYVAELYAGTDASSLIPLTASISRFRSSTTLSKGKWATTGIYGANYAVALAPGNDIRTIAFLQVKVWDFNQFSTYEAAAGNG